MIAKHTAHLKFDHKITSGLITKRCTQKKLSNMKVSPVHKMEGTLSKVLAHADQSQNPQPMSKVIDLAMHSLKVSRKDNAILFILRSRVDLGIAAIYGAHV